jgi:biopolymer transport protein ExbD/biopolymer transport protein TolR
MAFGRLERTRPAPPMSEINMTPLIDVMLVLLVIFMITAPLMASSLKLDLPKAKGGTPGDNPQILSLGLGPAGELYWADRAIDEAELIRQAHISAQQSPDTEVHLRADEKVPYGRVAQLIGVLQEAGLTRIGFITSPNGAPGTSSGAAPSTATPAPR